MRVPGEESGVDGLAAGRWSSGIVSITHQRDVVVVKRESRVVDMVVVWGSKHRMKLENS